MSSKTITIHMHKKVEEAPLVLALHNLWVVLDFAWKLKNIILMLVMDVCLCL